MRMEWTVRDSKNAIVGQTFSYPYFNTLRTNYWSAGTLVDDAYQLVVAPGTARGLYTLWLTLQSVDNSVDSFFSGPIGEIELPDIPAKKLEHLTSTDVRFGDGQVALEGFQLRMAGATVNQDQVDTPPLVQSGDRVEYTLFWRALRPIPENYHTFIHLLDVHQQPLVQVDQLPGPILSPPKLWNEFYPQPDVFRMDIPADTPSGLYSPHIGIYHFESQERLEAQNSDNVSLGDSYVLPPIKILNSSSVTPQYPVSANFQDGFALLGYDIEMAGKSVQAGETVTITLYYEGQYTPAKSYTQFLHLYSPELRVVAQHDSLPQAGANPTFTWAAGERIVDVLTLLIAEDTPTGTYELQVGFYDATASATRLAVADSQGRLLQNDQITLREILIE